MKLKKLLAFASFLLKSIQERIYMPVRIKDQANLEAEMQEKMRRIFTALDQHGCDSLVITRRDNFAWLSCGGRAVTSYITPTSPVFLLITPNIKYAIGHNMDVPRTMDEELTGQGYEKISLPTFSKSPAEAVRELAVGRLASDDLFPGAANLDPVVLALHEPFTPQDMERYRAVARESGEIIHQLACWVEPGMTERQVLGKMWGLYLEHDFDGDCMFVVSDDRIQRYRHAVPSQKVIEKALILAPAVYKYGLHVQISRLVYFEKPTEELYRRQNAMATLQGVMLASCTPGTSLNGLLRLCLEMFEKLGYPEERTNHMHGGPTGYRVSFPERCLDPKEVIKSNMAFSWYLTVKGAKTEETILVDENGGKLISVDPLWPMLDVVYEGTRAQVPDILIR
jgi:Xaa-Pro aminopeptidase